LDELTRKKRLWDQRGLVEDVLAYGAEDWVSIDWIIKVAQRANPPTDESLRMVALGLIASVLANGLMVAGDVDDEGFHPWEMSGDNAMRRIVANWQAAGLRPDDPYAVAWFSTTEEGDKIGQAVLRHEREELAKPE
jgi:hypothetical protein